MTSIFSLATTGVASAPPGGAKPTTLATLAKTADVPTLTVYARQHPGQRHALENAMVKANRSGDLSAMTQALKKRDFDVPIWNTMRSGSAGPAFPERPPSDPAYKVGNSPAWAELEKAGTATASEHAVIGHMTANEGRLDSVQSYDNQIVSVGAMQKTMDPNGRGELPRQVWDFRQAEPQKYQELFADKGWTAEQVGKGSAAAYELRLTVGGKTLTARETSAYIKDHGDPAHWDTALKPLQAAGRDPAFQAQQIGDFQRRLHQALDVVPAGANYTKPAGDYLTSEQGAALLMDHSVNRPNHVDNAFGAALDRFYAANPKTSRDPATWTTDQRATYEPEILKHYVATRELSYGKGPTGTMTDAKGRAAYITNSASPLSADPGSFHRT